ncbi:hypothetical protein [Amnibacterium kyonggiense]|nr:hypothetical protein [Amnibacterium kyonggiense]
MPERSTTVSPDAHDQPIPRDLLDAEDLTRLRDRIAAAVTAP